MNFVVMLSVPCAAGLFILSEPVVLLFSGSQYVSSITAMQIMNATVILIGMSNVIGIQIFMSVGKEKVTLYSVILGAVVNFCLNLILIPHFGEKGAAIGTVCAEFCVTLIQFVAARSYFDRKSFALHSGKVVAAAFVMSFFVFMLCRFINSFCPKNNFWNSRRRGDLCAVPFFTAGFSFYGNLWADCRKSLFKRQKGGSLKR